MKLSYCLDGLQHWLQDRSARYPAAPVLGGICAGIIVSKQINLPSLTVLLIITIIAAVLPWQRRITLIAALLAGILVTLYSQHNISSLPGTGYGTIEARIIDTSCGGEKNAWLKSPARLIVMVQRYRPYGGTWHKLSGRVALSLPRNRLHFSYGDIIDASGEWALPTRNPTVTRFNLSSVNGHITRTQYRLRGFNYRYYLQTHHIYRQFIGRQLKKTGRQSSILATIIDWRNRLMAKTVAGLSSSEQRGILAALLFGCRQGLPRQSRYSFIYSGTIHIFTVSGLHVGLLAVLLLFALRWLPFTSRYLLLPLLLLIYVISTGMHPPAVRAWLMISIWAVCRAYLLYTPTLNIVFLAAAVLLLYQPLFIADAGFQFSFVIVGFLVASSKKIAHLLRVIFEYRTWLPSELHSPTTHWRYSLQVTIIAALLGCGMAWLISSGLVLYYQGIYQPVAVIANFIIIPLVWLLFITVAGQFIMLLIPLATLWYSAVISTIIGAMLTICDFFYRYIAPIPTPRPELISLLIFYLAAAIMVSCKKVSCFAGAAVTLLVIIIYWHTTPLLMAPSLFIVHGGRSQIPGLIVAKPAEHCATIINAPSWEAANIMLNYLQSRGVNRIDKLIIQGGRRNFCAGAVRIFKRLPVNKLVIPQERQGYYLRQTVTAALKQRCQITVKKSSQNISSLTNRRIADYPITISMLNKKFHLHWYSNGLGERIVTIRNVTRSRYQLRLNNSNQLQAMELILPF